MARPWRHPFQGREPVKTIALSRTAASRNILQTAIFEALQSKEIASVRALEIPRSSSAIRVAISSSERALTLTRAAQLTAGNQIASTRAITLSRESQAASQRNIDATRSIEIVRSSIVQSSADTTQKDAGGGTSGGSSARRRVVDVTDLQKLLPKSLYKHYEKDTPQAEVAKRVVRAVKKVKPKEAAQVVQERGLSVLRDSHALFIAYVAHLLNVWDPASLNAVREATLKALLAAQSRKQMIDAASMLANDLDAQDEEELLLMASI